MTKTRLTDDEFDEAVSHFDIPSQILIDAARIILVKGVNSRDIGKYMSVDQGAANRTANRIRGKYLGLKYKNYG